MLVRYTDAFKRQLNRLSRKYRHIRSDVSPIIESLESGDTPGDQVPGVGVTIYKVRAKNTDAQSGKSGGYRLIYYIETKEDVLLVAIYSKVDQSDISADEIKHILDQEERKEN